MPVIASADAVRATRRRASSNGTPFWLTSYIGANRYTAGAAEPPPPGTIYPMAFLVEQDPGEVVGAHYHQADQFQVIVAGNGRLGRHDVARVRCISPARGRPTVRCAAGAAGLHYFTLRNGWDPGARYMEFPDNRAGLRGVARRHREVVGETDAVAADGFCARRVRIAAGASEIGPDPATRSRAVLAAAIGWIAGGRHGASPLSCVFVYPDEGSFVATAGGDGSDVAGDAVSSRVIALRAPPRNLPGGLAARTCSPRVKCPRAGSGSRPWRESLKGQRPFALG